MKQKHKQQNKNQQQQNDRASLSTLGLHIVTEVTQMCIECAACYSLMKRFAVYGDHAKKKKKTKGGLDWHRARLGYSLVLVVYTFGA